MHFLIKQETNERACQLSKGVLATVLSLMEIGCPSYKEEKINYSGIKEGVEY